MEDNFLALKNDLSSKLTLSHLRELIEPFKKIKILIAITCRPEFYDYLLKLPELKTETEFNSTFGAKIYIINSQKEQIKYWYINDKKKLDGYLKKNV